MSPITTAYAADINVQTAPEQPRHGDIIVAADATSPRYYAIRQVPGTPQVSWASREQALEVAIAYAQRHAVDLWFVDEMGARRAEPVRSTARIVTTQPTTSPTYTTRAMAPGRELRRWTPA